MLELRELKREEFNCLMKKRRIRTYIILSLIIGIFIYIFISRYSLSIKEQYCKFLINMECGNYSIDKLKDKRYEYEEKLNIEYENYDLDNNIQVGNKPKSIVFHHTAVENITAMAINEDHKLKGYGGIGYHFYIRKDGTIYRGRPEECIGAHAIGKNYDSIGICLEGNFEDEFLSAKQKESLIRLSTDMIIKYNIEEILGHRDVDQTLCPGKNFCIEDIKQAIKDEIIYISK